METALRIYLSDMPESEKLAAIRAEWSAYAVYVDHMTGSKVVESWESDDLALEATFLALNWI